MDKYKFTISMNVMENLGEGLYSSVPAVIAEAIANSYDADAENVKINFDIENGMITIEDDGNGMNLSECNDKYLNIGYHKREKGEVISPIWERPVMGRKGIGKLSLFSIARNIKLHSVKTDKDGNIIERNGFIMDLDKIKANLKHKKVSESKEIPLESIDLNNIKIKKGTKIILTNLKKNILINTSNFLRRRLARKFSILGEKYNFKVFVNDEEISIEDRNYLEKIQYLWHFGDRGEECVKECKNLEQDEKINNEITLDDGTKFLIEGWIGTIDERSNLPDGENTIILHSRGRSTQDDILKNIDNSGFVTKYLIGEITAEFLDNDDQDIITSDRQSINENSERFEKIKEFVKKIVNRIRVKWQEWREDTAMDKACEIPAIKTWFASLKGDSKKYAKQLFGKIDKFPISDKGYKKELYRNAILAFQTLSASNNLSKLESINENQIEPFLKLLSEMDQIEAAHYHGIVRIRMNVLKKFENLVDINVKEATLQEYIFEHLWLLDPSWERADSKNKRIEQSVKREFKNVKLTPEEEKARIDIRYRSSAGKHIIIELKRYDVKVDIDLLIRQLRKYKRALSKCLEAYPDENGPIEIISILGSTPKNATTQEAKASLDSIGARYITYDQLIQNTLNGYGDYLKENNKISEIQKLVESII